MTRSGLNYEYRLPDAWKQTGNEEAIRELRTAAVALRALLVALTGPVVVRRLARLAVFREHGIDFGDEVPT